MEKYMLELELRYRKVVGDDDTYTTPKIIIGIYDTWEDAEVRHLYLRVTKKLMTLN